MAQPLAYSTSPCSSINMDYQHEQHTEHLTVYHLICPRDKFGGATPPRMEKNFSVKPLGLQVVKRERGTMKQRPSINPSISMGQCTPVLTTALPHENLPFSASNRHFPTTLLWSFPQICNFAHPLESRRRTWHSLERKWKIFHEASLPSRCSFHTQLS
jgi:hypothetical protein